MWGIVLSVLDMRCVLLQSPEDLYSGGNGQTLWVSIADWVHPWMVVRKAAKRQLNSTLYDQVSGLGDGSGLWR